MWNNLFLVALPYCGLLLNIPFLAALTYGWSFINWLSQGSVTGVRAAND
jgi:hypothetical protein